MNQYDLWKWAAGKRTAKATTYSWKNWLYVLGTLGAFAGIMLLYYLIAILWQ